MNFRASVKRLYELAVGTFIWCVCAGIIWGLVLGLRWLVGDEPLLPPGWDCSAVEIDPQSGNHLGQCVPQKGWHFEEDLAHGGRIAVQDITHTRKDRQRDIDTAELWRDLTNDQRQKILDHKGTVYDFIEPKSSN